MAKQLNIKIVFIAHDYFGICPKVTMFTQNQPCEEVKTCANCFSCNQSALSLSKIRILQSPLYRNLKNTRIVKKLRKKHRTGFYDTEQMVISQETVNEKARERYVMLRRFYTDILEMMDLVLFNSSLTKDVYLKFCSLSKWEIFPISHINVSDKNTRLFCNLGPLCFK